MRVFCATSGEVVVAGTSFSWNLTIPTTSRRQGRILCFTKTRRISVSVTPDTEWPEPTVELVMCRRWELTVVTSCVVAEATPSPSNKWWRGANVLFSGVVKWSAKIVLWPKLSTLANRNSANIINSSAYLQKKVFFFLLKCVFVLCIYILCIMYCKIL